MASPYGAPLISENAGTGNAQTRQPPRFPPAYAPDRLPPSAADQGPSSGASGPAAASGSPAASSTPPSPPPPWTTNQGPPPFAASADTPSGGTTIPPTAPVGAGWGNRNETYFLPPQFSYRPDQDSPAPPAPPAPKRDRKRLVIAAATAAAVVVAGGITAGVLLMGGSTKPTTAGGTTSGPMVSDSRTGRSGTTPAWSAPAATDQKAATPVGSWLVDNAAVVRGDATGLQSYDAASGKAQWTFSVPDQGSTICAMSQLAIRKIGIVQYGKDSCDHIAAINTDTGKSAWDTQIPGGVAGSVPSMTSGGDVVAGTAGTTVTVWSAADGRKLWDVDVAKAKPPCRLFQAGVKGATVALVADCGKGTAVMAKDAHSGVDIWQTPLPPDGLNGAQITLVAAAFPTLVHVESPAGAATPFDRYYSFDEKGRAQPPIDGTGPFGKLDLRFGTDAGARQVPHVQGSTLIAATAAQDPATGKAPAAGVVAFDLTTGKQLWAAPAPAGAPVAIAALDPNRAVVFDGGGASTPARLLAFSMTTGNPVASGISGGLGSDWVGPATAYLTADRLILVPNAPEKGFSVVGFALR